MCGAVIEVGRKTPQGFETWRKAYGLSRTQPTPRQMKLNAIFDLASLTKPIATGTSLMVLVDQGKVGVDDPVGQYLAEFNRKDKKNVLVRHLMTHTSGEIPYIGAAGQKKIKDKHGFPCVEATRARIRGLALARPPGEHVVYSCLNAILCAEIVEAASGMPLDRFAAEHIFGPLGMKDTGFKPAPTLSGRIVPTTRAKRGTGEGGFLQGQVHDPIAAMQDGVSGNAGLFSTAEDLGRFAQMMLNGGVLQGTRVLGAETVAKMTSVQNPNVTNLKGRPDRRGLLWDIYQPDPHDTGVDAIYAYGHTGYTGTAMRVYPEHGVYIIALANRVHPDDSAKVGAFRSGVWRAVGSLLMATDDPVLSGARGR
jgi:CubicO group peptidase (beta-lactamase class C family)